MAGFGAGFARALGASLDAAGKSHLEEQRRTREYERARADRQAERLEDRAWQQEDYERRKQDALAEENRKQAIEDEENPLRVSFKGGKWYYTARDGSQKELQEDDPIVGARKRYDIEAAWAAEEHNLNIAAKKAGIERDRVGIARDRAEMERAKQGKTLYEQLSPSEKSIIDSVALGDPTYLKGNYTGDQLKARRPSGVPKHMLPSYVELARAVQEGDIEAYRELKPVLGQIYKETPPKAK